MKTLAIGMLACTLAACTLPPQPQPETTAQETSEISPPLISPPLPPPMLALTPTPAIQPMVKEPDETPGVPDKVIAHANQAAMVTPRKKGYFGASAIQRYVYQPGKVYLIVSSPQHPTTLFLPPGERLASFPMFDAETWEGRATELGEGKHRQEVIEFRPYKAGAEMSIALLTQGGRSYFCRIRAQDKPGMVGVVWELPAITVVPKTEEGQLLVNPGQFYGAYSFYSVGKRDPNWMPAQVFDDGQRTFIRFAGSLTHTSAPAVFAKHPDKTPAIVEFSPYTSAGNLYYVVQGLWDELYLKGEPHQEVKITRGGHAR